ncbi:hypothetical protein E5D57_008381 [Metarhizium anisopliae]|nr:hypothetical protein E5D57_008381 [Metarhizium anisopliae]
MMRQAVAKKASHGGHVTLRTTLEAVLAAVASQYFTARSSELYSEVLSWALLPFYITSFKGPSRSKANHVNLPLGESGKLSGLGQEEGYWNLEG